MVGCAGAPARTSGADLRQGHLPQHRGPQAHGYRLYVETWDQKPPLFYYLNALAYEFGGWRGPFLADIAWVAVATWSLWRLLRLVGASPRAEFVGVMAYPPLLAGAFFFAGMAEVPPVALSTVAAWLWARGNTGAAGGAFGLLAFLRPDLALVWLALLGALVVGRPRPDCGWWRAPRRFAAGAVVVATAWVGVLAARGELGGWWGKMRNDTGHPDRVLQASGLPAGVYGHVLVIWNNLSPVRRDLAILWTVVVLALLGFQWWAHRAHRASFRPESTSLGWLAGGSLASTIITLVFSAMWDHTLEFLALPAVLSAAWLVTLLDSLAVPRWPAVCGAALVGVVAAAAWGGLSVGSPSSLDASLPARSWLSIPGNPGSRLLNRTLPGLRAARLPTTYARVGPNSDRGHAAFLDPSLRLACPVWAQYPISPNLREALACLKIKRPSVVLAGPGFRIIGGPYPDPWNRFVRSARRILRGRYVIVSRAEDPMYGPLAVWRLRT